MRDVGIGLIGTGFMGKAHVFGFTSAPRVFELPYDLELHTVADITDEAAERARQTLGFDHATSDWRTIMANPEIDLVSITAPNALHKEMSLAAIAAGKHVYCEKPLAPLAADALEMTLAAEAKANMPPMAEAPMSAPACHGRRMRTAVQAARTIAAASPRQVLERPSRG